MNYIIREMAIDDYDEVISLWQSSPEINIDDSDSRENLVVYIKRNPGLCHVAVCDHAIIGTIKCGHDGRRGYLHHLVIHKNFRHLGIGDALIKKSLASLRSQGIQKCNTFVLDKNKDALEFWLHNNWEVLDYYYRTLQINTNVSLDKT